MNTHFFGWPPSDRKSYAQVIEKIVENYNKAETKRSVVITVVSLWDLVSD